MAFTSRKLSQLKDSSNQIMDCFGVLTTDWVNVRGNIIDRANKDLVIDYYDPDGMCHPQYSYQIYTIFNEDGYLTDKDPKYTNNGSYNYHQADIFTLLFTSRRSDPYREFFSVPLESIPKEHYIENLADSCFYHKNFKQYFRKQIPFRKTRAYKSITDDPTKDSDNYKFGLKSKTFTVTEGKKYSMGHELETCSGIIPAYLDKEFNYEAVYDGSIKDNKGNTGQGGEYVSGVLIGDSGFIHLKKLCYELTKRCKVNYTCGHHLHVSGVNFNTEFIVYLYKLCRDIEKELFAMLPPSRRNNEYCAPLKAIDINLNMNFNDRISYEIYIEEIYSRILTWVAHQEGNGTINPAIINKKKQHPLGNKCGYNHNTARYCWLNLVPALFNTRGNGVYTLEFRPNSGTTNYKKIKNWTLVCFAIVYMAENEKTFIAKNKCTLKDIIMISYPKTGEKLYQYVQERTKLFNNESNQTSSVNEALDYEDTSNDEDLTIKSL